MCPRFSAIFCENISNFIALAAAMNEEHNCSSAVCRRKHSSYNIHVKLDVICHRKRDKDVIDIPQSIPLK
jgi:hypothetical protein